MSIKTGTRFDYDDTYEVLSRIGNGANGTAYLLKDEDSFFVLKVADNTPSAIEVMNNEANVMQEMQNAGRQFQIYDSSESDLKKGECPWILMDYVPGVNLFELLEAVRGTDDVPLRKLKQVYKYTFSYGIAKELSFFHEQKMTHRDLKPNNIFIDPNFIPHIGDMGDTTTHSQTQRAHGTVNFLPPEAIPDGGSIHITHAYDIYEFGGTLLEILTFEWPYSDINPDGSSDNNRLIKEKIKNGETDSRFEPGGELDNYLSQEDDLLYDIVKQCWIFNPEDRPTIESILEQIDQAAESRLSPEDLEYYNQFKESLEDEVSLGSSSNIQKAVDVGLASLKLECSDTLKCAAEDLDIDIPDANSQLLFNQISVPFK